MSRGRARSFIEERSERDLLFVGTLKAVDKHVGRSDGLLQRKVVFEVVRLFLGKPTKSTVEAHEIVGWPRHFTGTEGPQRLLILVARCVEEGGKELLVVQKARSATARELDGLAANVENFSPKAAWKATPCSLATESALLKWESKIESDGA